jgi:hypothetical protein
MAKKKSAKKSAVKRPAPGKTHRVGAPSRPSATAKSSSGTPNKKVKGKVKPVVSKKKKTTVKAAPQKIKKSIVKKVPLKGISKQKVIAVKPPKEKKVIVSKEVKEPVEKSLLAKRTRKSSKKQIITLPPPPKIEVSNYPKNKVKSILVSQPKPLDPEKNPYVNLGKKYNLNINFRHFIKVEGLSSQDFRAQRIDILEHGAVILTSKLSVDHYFKMCNEMRVTVPESMKYFCLNEQTAYYLQKYIQYRKRKIFFGHGTMLDLVDVIRKNKDEKFLLPVSDVHKEQIIEFLDELHITYTKS